MWKPSDLSNLFSRRWHTPNHPNALASQTLSPICLAKLNCFWYTLIASSRLFILIKTSPMLAKALNLAWLCFDTWAIAEKEIMSSRFIYKCSILWQILFTCINQLSFIFVQKKTEQLEVSEMSTTGHLIGQSFTKLHLNWLKLNKIVTWQISLKPGHFW